VNDIALLVQGLYIKLTYIMAVFIKQEPHKPIKQGCLPSGIITEYGSIMTASFQSKILYAFEIPKM
jgi:hypothetical protein